VNGLVSGTLAVLLLIGMGIYTNNIIPELSALMEPASIAGLLLLVIVIGIVISGLSTYRSVNKYLKLKLDDLY
jgi:cell division transport system permease protein